MNLYKVTSNNWINFFGDTPPEQADSHPEMTKVAQLPDCSASLFLSNETYVNEAAELLDAVPSGYDFVYNQSWGLDVNQAVLDRVIEDLG